METRNTDKQQENYIARGYKREIVTMVENQIDDSDTKFLQQTHTIIKCYIARKDKH